MIVRVCHPAPSGVGHRALAWAGGRRVAGVGICTFGHPLVQEIPPGGQARDGLEGGKGTWWNWGGGLLVPKRGRDLRTRGPSRESREWRLGTFPTTLRIPAGRLSRRWAVFMGSYSLASGAQRLQCPQCPQQHARWHLLRWKRLGTLCLPAPHASTRAAAATSGEVWLSLRPCRSPQTLGAAAGAGIRMAVFIPRYQLSLLVSPPSAQLTGTCLLPSSGWKPGSLGPGIPQRKWNAQ